MNNYLKFAPISVVIPCYKSESFLGRAVDSVLSQSVLPLELILIDDASPDDGRTKALIEKIVKQIPLINPSLKAVPVYLDKNGGPGYARNAGWRIATQPWIAFLDADDVWNSYKLELQYGSLQINPSIDLLAHKSQFMKSDILLNERKITANSILIHRIELKQMLVSNLFPARSVMLRREIPLRFPGRRESEDYSLWLQAIAKGYDVRLMDCVLAYTFRPEYSKGGYSGLLWDQEKRELHTLATLHKDGHINVLVLFATVIWSILKFIRRTLIIFFNIKSI